MYSSVKNLLFGLMLACTFLLHVPTHTTAKEMTIALPASVIKQSLKDILPMKIDAPKKYLDGILILSSIDKLIMGDNSAILQGLVLGKNLSLITQVGGQDIRIKVGNLHLPLTCDLSFRFDPKQKRLFVRPQIRQPASGSLTDMASSVTSLLTAFNNREYPVSLASLQSFNLKIGKQDILMNMVPVDVKVSKGQLNIKMLPRLRKAKRKTN